MKMTQCIVCGTEFELRTNKRLCSAECFEKRKNQRVREWMVEYRRDPGVRERTRQRLRAKYFDPEFRLRMLSRAGTVKNMNDSARLRAKKKGMTFELTREFIDGLITAQGDRCAITGIPFDYGESTDFERRPFAASLDRINSKLGYSKDNVHIVCIVVNGAKSEYSQEIFDRMCIARVDLLRNS